MAAKLAGSRLRLAGSCCRQLAAAVWSPGGWTPPLRRGGEMSGKKGAGSEAEAGGAPHWATVMTDPNWPGDDSPVHGWGQGALGSMGRGEQGLC